MNKNVSFDATNRARADAIAALIETAATHFRRAEGLLSSIAGPERDASAARAFDISVKLLERVAPDDVELPAAYARRVADEIRRAAKDDLRSDSWFIGTTEDAIKLIAAAADAWDSKLRSFNIAHRHVSSSRGRLVYVESNSWDANQTLVVRSNDGAMEQLTLVGDVVALRVDVNGDHAALITRTPAPVLWHIDLAAGQVKEMRSLSPKARSLDSVLEFWLCAFENGVAIADTASGAIELRRWDGEIIATLDLEQSPTADEIGVASMAVSHDLRWLAVQDTGEVRFGGASETRAPAATKVYDFAQNTWTRINHIGEATRLLFSGDARFLVSNDRIVRTSDLSRLDHTVPAYHRAIAIPQTARFVLHCEERFAIYDAEHDQVLARFGEGIAVDGDALSIEGDGTMCTLYDSSARRVRAWSIATTWATTVRELDLAVP